MVVGAGGGQGVRPARTERAADPHGRWLVCRSSLAGAVRITFVKKILASGQPCAKCADVQARLEAAGQLVRIDEVAVADERNPESRGMRLAARHGVAAAPFFLVEQDGRTTVYTIYLKFAKEVFGRQADGPSEAQEMLRADPGLDLI